ncbi:K Homology domain, type 1 [Cinara cedri]|uniref:K Homology domain, type 1 n=1 Tax=Cinara cedri TaxID=506608 RepID=A0A5E4MMB9_9HEMI|nr:K Homology domain, type 1 [Cinara cedri]
MPAVSTETDDEDIRDNDKTYNQEFPVIQEAKALGTKNMEINRKRQGLMKTPKLVNQSFTVSVQDNKFKNGELIAIENARRICRSFIDLGVAIEISATKSQTDLTFIVSGKLNDVLDAKNRIMNQIQAKASTETLSVIFGFQPSLEQVVQAIKELMKEFDIKKLPGREKTAMGNCQCTQEKPFDTSVV